MRSPTASRRMGAWNRNRSRRRRRRRPALASAARVAPRAVGQPRRRAHRRRGQAQAALDPAQGAQARQAVHHRRVDVPHDRLRGHAQRVAVRGRVRAADPDPDELGHAQAIRRAGLSAGYPVFIPFFGAMIALRGRPRLRWWRRASPSPGRSRGPPPAGAAAIYFATHQRLFLALGYSGCSEPLQPHADLAAGRRPRRAALLAPGLDDRARGAGRDVPAHAGRSSC